MVQVPKVNRGDASLEIHFSVLVECSVGINLQLPQSLAWHRAVIQGGLVLVAPGGPEQNVLIGFCRVQSRHLMLIYLIETLAHSYFIITCENKWQTLS